MKLYRDLTMVVKKVKSFTLPPTTEQDLVNRIGATTSLTSDRAQEIVELALKREFIEQKANGEYRCTVYGAQYAKRGWVGRVDLFVGSFNTHPAFIATLALIVSIAAIVVAWIKD